MRVQPIAPMLAVPMSKADIKDWDDYIAEEKYDGWRVVVTIPAHDPIVAHTRERKHAGGGPKDQNDVTDLIPAEMMREFEMLRPRNLFVTLDGELLPPALVSTDADGKPITPRPGTSTDVPRKDLAKRYVAFDVLTTPAGSSMMLPYAQRRTILSALLAPDAGAENDDFEHVMLAEARECVDTETVSAFTHEVWGRGGEGLILKRKNARYEAGKRREAFVKIKKLFTAVCRVTGFEATRGTVMNRGPFATLVLEVVTPAKEHPGTRSAVTSVKTKDDFELNRLNRQWEQVTKHRGSAPGCTNDRWTRGALADTSSHPAIGRLLRIEYQDVAAEGGLRHPRWDRWEDE